MLSHMDRQVVACGSILQQCHVDRHDKTSMFCFFSFDGGACILQSVIFANCKNRFVQNAQKKSKNLFVRPHKKIGAFSNKEDDDVAEAKTVIC